MWGCLYFPARVDYEKSGHVLDPEECFLAEKFVEILGSKSFTQCLLKAK